MAGQDFSYVGGPNWGPLANIDTSNLRQSQTNENIAQTMKAFGDIAMMPAEEQLKREQANQARSHAGLLQAQQQAAERQAAVQAAVLRKQQERAQGAPGAQGPQGQAPSMLDQLSQGVQAFTDLSRDQLDAGDFSGASKSFTTASTSGERFLQGKAADMLTRQRTLKLQHDKQEHLLGILQDPSMPFEQRKVLAMQAEPPDNPQEQTFLQNLREDQVPGMARAMMTQREREQSDLTAQNNKSMDQLRKARETLVDQETKLAAARTRMLDTRRDLLGKEGEKIKEPTAAEKTSAENVVREAFPQMPGIIKDEPLWNGAVRNVAARAQILQSEARRQGKTLSSEDARRQALKEEQAQGTFSTVLSPGWTNLWGRLGGGEPTPGGRAGAPLPLPKDAKDRIVGKVYETPKGLGKYLGGGHFEAVAAPARGSKPLTAEEEDLLGGEESSSSSEEE